MPSIKSQKWLIQKSRRINKVETLFNMQELTRMTNISITKHIFLMFCSDHESQMRKRISGEKSPFPLLRCKASWEFEQRQLLAACLQFFPSPGPRLSLEAQITPLSTQPGSLDCTCMHLSLSDRFSLWFQPRFPWSPCSLYRQTWI